MGQHSLWRGGLYGFRWFVDHRRTGRAGVRLWFRRARIVFSAALGVGVEEPPAENTYNDTNGNHCC